MFPYFGNFIIPTGFHIFQRGRLNHQAVLSVLYGNSGGSFDHWHSTSPQNVRPLWENTLLADAKSAKCLAETQFLGIRAAPSTLGASVC